MNPRDGKWERNGEKGYKKGISHVKSIILTPVQFRVPKLVQI